MEQGLAIEVTGLETRFGQAVIHHNLNLAVKRAEIMALVGGSGTGKSVLLRNIVGLMTPYAGKIEVLGELPSAMSPRERHRFKRRWGMLFQDGALFSSLTVAENIEVPLREHLSLPAKLRREVATLKIAMVGLAPDAANKYPAELSGGMRKRVGIARATIASPPIVIYDEPSAGLDPVTTSKIYDLLTAIQDESRATVMAVSSDIVALRGFVDRIAMIHQGRLIYDGPESELDACEDPVVHQFIRGEVEGPL